ncbi:MAG: NmrA family NAD(P)-binding protein [Chitinophagaceae bacterium]
MKPIILVAGGTGNLGSKIIHALLSKGADVRAIVRSETNKQKVDELDHSGVHVIEADMESEADLRQACESVTCVVSALQGLEDVIVDTQSRLLNAALVAGVRHFIPSDFSVDFTDLKEGDNRNFDLRRRFRSIIDQKPIRATSIFNSAFAENLTHGMPFLDIKTKKVGYVESPDLKIDFTSMDNTAWYTAEAALDDLAPRDLHIASFRISAKEMAALATEVFGSPFQLYQLATLDQLAEKNKKDREADPEGEKKIYPRWQQSQYMHSMFSVRTGDLDNLRYPVKWDTARDLLISLKNGK